MGWGTARGRQVVAGLAPIGPALAGCAGAARGVAEDAVRAEIVEYAEGDWRCQLELPASAVADMPENWSTLRIEATVRSTGDAAGEVVFTIDLGGVGEHESSGVWALDGTDLQVDMSTVVETSYAMAGVDLATDRIEIREDDPGAGLVPVDVERDGDSVRFGWDDPWTGEPAAMTCTKA